MNAVIDHGRAARRWLLRAGVASAFSWGALWLGSAWCTGYLRISSQPLRFVGFQSGAAVYSELAPSEPAVGPKAAVYPTANSLTCWIPRWEAGPPRTAFFALPLWIPLALTLAGTWLLWRWDDPRRKAGHCRNCGYDLRVTASGCCPECGMAAAEVEVDREHDDSTGTP